jgi:hypothetical protein
MLQSRSSSGSLAVTVWRNQGAAAMILKLTTNDKASILGNLLRILQMTLIDPQDGHMRLPPTSHGGGCPGAAT